VAPKSFVDPRSCLAVFNHYCYVSLVPQIQQLDVSPHLARSHHYRLCNFAADVCQQMFDSSTYDNIMMKFKRRLRPAVEAVLAQLNISISRSNAARVSLISYKYPS